MILFYFFRVLTDDSSRAWQSYPYPNNIICISNCECKFASLFVFQSPQFNAHKHLIMLAYTNCENQVKPLFSQICPKVTRHETCILRTHRLPFEQTPKESGVRTQEEEAEESRPTQPANFYLVFRKKQARISLYLGGLWQ